MMDVTRRWIGVAGLTVVLTAMAAPASAQIIHSLSLGAGVFTPRGFAGRVDGDVWVANQSQPELEPGVTGSLAFDIGDFQTMSFFGEWNVQFNHRLEVGVGLGYYGDTVDSRYRDLVNSAAGFSDIKQQLQLRAIPITPTVRFLPFGKTGGFQPYVGTGLAIINFKYTEAGEFVDTSDYTIFSDKYVADGWAVGPVVLGGMRIPIGGGIWAITVEGRYQWASGDTGGFDAGFLGDKLDLSGGYLQFGALIRF